MLELVIVLVPLPSRPVSPERERLQGQEGQHYGQVVDRHTLHYSRKRIF